MIMKDGVPKLNGFSKHSVDDFCQTSTTKGREEEHAIISTHQCSLTSQLTDPCTTSDPILVLHLSCLYLFTKCHPGALLHASGKYVAQIVKFGLKELQKQRQEEDIWTILVAYQNRVMSMIKSQTAISEQETLLFIKTVVTS